MFWTERSGEYGSLTLSVENDERFLKHRFEILNPEFDAISGQLNSPFQKMTCLRIMNQAKNPSNISESSPLSVLESIKATQGIANELSPTSDSEIANSDPMREPSQDSPKEDLIPIRIHPETTWPVETPSHDPIENHVESSNQVQQLAHRLRQNELEFDLRSNRLNQKIQAWNQTVSVQKALHEKNISQLQQQASQVRCQQLHLMQLQTDIVKSYEATRAAIEKLIDENFDASTAVVELKKLKYELSGRFDFIARRWEHLAKLMQAQRDQEAARIPGRTSADWLGETA